MRHLVVTRGECPVPHNINEMGNTLDVESPNGTIRPRHWRGSGMLPEIKKIILSVGATALVGALFGGIMGVLAADFLSLEYFLWVGISATVGASLGVALAYGLLPES